MHYDDISAVQAIEQQIFPAPWPRNAYASELSQNRNAQYITLRRDDEIVGYAGLWKVVNEAHVTTIGVRSEDHGKGYGRGLFASLILHAYALEAHWMTLEVRPSNMPAITLYESFNFKVIGRRRGYYTDSGEDAIVMWSGLLHAPQFKANFARRDEGLTVSGLGTLPSPGYPAG